MSISVSKKILDIIQLLKNRNITPEEALSLLKNKDALPSSLINNNVEDEIYGCIAEVIEVLPLKLKSGISFRNLGVDSILSAKFIEKINKTFVLKLSPPIIFEFATVKDFVDYILHLLGSYKPRELLEKERANNLSLIANDDSIPSSFTEEESFELLWEDSSQLDNSSIILLSGLGCMPQMLSNIQTGLAKHRPVITYAPLGHSPDHSTIQDLPKDLYDLVCHFDNFIQQSTFTKPLHLIGWSLGGIIAQLFAAQHPEKVKTLTILCSSVQALPEGSLFNRSAKEFDCMKENRLVIPEDLFLTLPSPYLEAYKVILEGFNLVGQARSVKCPTLIINVAHDHIMHKEHHLNLKKAYLNARVKTLKQKNLGHFGVYTHSDLFLKEINCFLN